MTELLQRADQQIGRFADAVDRGDEGAKGLLAQAEQRHQDLLQRRDRCGFPEVIFCEGKATEWRWLPPGAYYQVPYRALLAGEVDNLLFAGRCISATHEALASTRVIAPSMAQGEAAGVAAAIASQKGLAAAAVDVGEVQRVLRERGAFLG